GIVTAKNAIHAPLSHVACVGYHLVGSTEGSEIDDAELVAFEVVTAEGERVLVPAGPATLSLEPDLDPRTVAPDETLAQFLDKRANLVSLEPVRLTEALLRLGEEVVVENVETKRTTQDDYRDTRETRVIVEVDGAPRVVRRP